MQIISIFNNKGGVGKTTYMFHIAHILSRRGKSVLMVDLDTQGNLTGYCFEDTEISNAWSENGNSIYRIIEPIVRGIGDFQFKEPSKLQKAEGDVHLVPGDLRLSDFEDLLGDAWNAARGGSEAQIRVQTAIHRYIVQAAEYVGADIVMVDLGPNLGALNRVALASSDYFLTPVAPDLFSIQGTENLGNKLVSWSLQWAQIHSNWSGTGVEIPHGTPQYLGYVMQMHNVRSRGRNGMTDGWNIYGERIEGAVQENIAGKIGEGRVVPTGSNSLLLARIPNLHSLVPYSQEARKPIFDCTGADGLRGEHQTKAREAIELFEDIVGVIEGVL
ncbi:MAG: AAA family ATPase [Pseudomonadota bacterium]